MSRSPRYRLSDAEKDALLAQQAALIEQQALAIEALRRQVAELQAALARPKKTSRNGHVPPSQDPRGGDGGSGAGKPKPRKKRPSRPGVSRRLAATPDATVVCHATHCQGCGADVRAVRQRRRRRYDHVDIPPIVPHVTRIELHGGRCPTCRKRFTAEPPAGMAPGSPFGANIHAFLAYLHHGHHVGFERLARMMRELFGLTLSEGAIANALQRLADPLAAVRRAIRERLRAAAVIASDETTTRIDGVTHWHWVFVGDQAVLHEITPRRAKATAEAVLGDRRPEVWVSDRYAGQQDLAKAQQVCLAHVLRDVQYAADCGDTRVAPQLTKLLQWAIRVGRRRRELADSTLGAYRGKAERRLDELVATPAPHPAGRELQALIKAWRCKLFVFLEDRRVPATNNESEREIRHSVVFRKVTGGFRSTWGAEVHAGYRSLTSTAARTGHTAFDAIRDLVDGALRTSSPPALAPTT
jgi:transposase